MSEYRRTHQPHATGMRSREEVDNLLSMIDGATKQDIQKFTLDESITQFDFIGKIENTDDKSFEIHFSDSRIQPVEVLMFVDVDEIPENSFFQRVVCIQEGNREEDKLDKRLSFLLQFACLGNLEKSIAQKEIDNILKD